jgi:cytochrome c biogenesis protein CcmG, thiol:disulfide interchange protein DsbE
MMWSVTTSRLRAALSMVWLLASCASLQTGTTASSLVGRPLDAAVADLQGQPFRLEPHGQVQVVDFWATWCEPCRDQLPVLDLLSTAYAERGLTVTLISVDEDLAQVQAFAAATPVHYRMLWDKGGARLAERLDLQRLPTTLVLDRAGVVRFVHVGFQPEHADRLAREVKQLLAEPAP